MSIDFLLLTWVNFELVNSRKIKILAISFNDWITERCLLKIDYSKEHISDGYHLYIHVLFIRVYRKHMHKDTKGE